MKREIIFFIHTRTLLGAYCLSNSSFIDKKEETFVKGANEQKCSFENINACQYIEDRSLLFQFSFSAGFASEMNNLFNAFVYAVATNRRLLIDGKEWNYGQFDDYFHLDKGHFSPVLPSSSYCKSRQFVYLKESTVWEAHLRTSRDPRGTFDPLNAVFLNLEKAREKENLTRLGTVEVKRHVAHYFWKTISSRTKQMIKQLKKNASLPREITFAIHIRQGDKIREARPVRLPSYIDAIDKLVSIHNGE